MKNLIVLFLLLPLFSLSQEVRIWDFPYSDSTHHRVGSEICSCIYSDLKENGHKPDSLSYYRNDVLKDFEAVMNKGLLILEYVVRWAPYFNYAAMDIYFEEIIQNSACIKAIDKKLIALEDPALKQKTYQVASTYCNFMFLSNLIMQELNPEVLAYNACRCRGITDQQMRENCAGIVDNLTKLYSEDAVFSQEFDRLFNQCK